VRPPTSSFDWPVSKQTNDWLNFPTENFSFSGLQPAAEHKVYTSQPTSSDILSVEMDGQMKPAMQWVFKGEDSGEQKFEESCAGKGWIHDIGTFR
jgi:hypothetical protein